MATNLSNLGYLNNHKEKFKSEKQGAHPDGLIADSPRRGFLLSLSVWLSSCLTLFLGIGACFRFLTPPDRGHVNSRIRFRHPDDIAQGWTHLRKEGIFLWREGRSFRAMSGICTHLGCAVNRDAAAGRYHCPCHGSRF